MNEPATKQDLDNAVGTLRSEMSEMKDLLRGELRSDISEMDTRARIDMAMMENRLRVDMKAMNAEVRNDMKTMETRLHTDMQAMEERILKEIGAAASKVADVMTNHHRGHFKVLDEKYQDLPKQHAELRADFDTHAADRRLHARLPVAPPRRLRRPRSR